LEQSLRYCAADEQIITDPGVYSDIAQAFTRMGSLALGGQAAISATHLRRLGYTQVNCVAPGAGPWIRAMLLDSGVTPITFPETGDRPDKVHIIFEHNPGLVPLAQGVVPRGNRFIVSPAHPPSSILIPGKMTASFYHQIRQCKRAFLSGYQYLRSEEVILAAASQLKEIRNVNPQMRTHIECVSSMGEKCATHVLEHVFPVADSIGMNEQELGLFIHAMDSAIPREPSSSPLTLVRDALFLSRALRVPRVHVHTFGYYVLVIKPGPNTNPGSSRDALLYASQQVALAAGGTDKGLSREGRKAYAEILSKYGPEDTTGIFNAGDRIVVVVPTIIAQNVKKTTGLGDIISSTAFVADPF